MHRRRAVCLPASHAMYQDAVKKCRKTHEDSLSLLRLVCLCTSSYSHCLIASFAAAMFRFLVLLICLQAAACFKAVPRREALQITLGFATLSTPLAPAMAKSKASLAPNKAEGVGANAGAYLRDQYKNEYQSIAGDKGMRGVASSQFDKEDTVVKNRRENGSLARDANGKKIVIADRNRDPAELGLKQWDGSTAGNSKYGSSSSGLENYGFRY